jgi:hypothetical protein
MMSTQLFDEAGVTIADAVAGTNEARAGLVIWGNDFTSEPTPYVEYVLLYFANFFDGSTNKTTFAACPVSLLSGGSSGIVIENRLIAVNNSSKPSSFNADIVVPKNILTGYIRVEDFTTVTRFQFA